jgi:predicted transcriptional regulator
MRTGNYWWEQWFTIEERRKKETKKCKFCDWETEDILNMSGAYEVHLRKCHNITKNEYLEKFPEEKPYFALVSPVLNRQMSSNTDEFVICKVCGKKMGSLNANHLRKHGLTKYSYFEKYGIQETISKNFHDKCSENAKLTNMNSVFHKTSKAEDEISDFIKSLGFEVEQSTRRILEGKEMDIYIPSIKTGFEFNGLYFHTENYGKTQFYHQRKTN